MLKYLELKTGYGHSGPAWIGYVKESKTGKTLYFNGRALQRMKKGGIYGNYLDVETREEFWVSNVKKNGEDRHWAGSGKILIEATAVVEYLTITGATTLPTSKYEVFEQALSTDIAKFHRLANEKLTEEDRKNLWLTLGERFINSE